MPQTKRRALPAGKSSSSRALEGVLQPQQSGRAAKAHRQLDIIFRCQRPELINAIARTIEVLCWAATEQ